MKPQKVSKSKEEEEPDWPRKWNDAGLRLASLVMDETDTPHEALFLLDIAKTMIENAIKAVEIEAKKRGIEEVTTWQKQKP